MAEQGEVDTVRLEEWLEQGSEAWAADVAIVVVVRRAVDGLVGERDNPRRDGAIDRGEVGRKELELGREVCSVE